MITGLWKAAVRVIKKSAANRYGEQVRGASRYGRVCRVQKARCGSMLSTPARPHDNARQRAAGNHERQHSRCAQVQQNARNAANAAGR